MTIVVLEALLIIIMESLITNWIVVKFIKENVSIYFCLIIRILKKYK